MAQKSWVDSGNWLLKITEWYERVDGNVIWSMVYFGIWSRYTMCYFKRYMVPGRQVQLVLLACNLPGSSIYYAYV